MRQIVKHIRDDRVFTKCVSDMQIQVLRTWWLTLLSDELLHLLERSLQPSDSRPWLNCSKRITADSVGYFSNNLSIGDRTCQWQLEEKMLGNVPATLQRSLAWGLVQYSR